MISLMGPGASGGDFLGTKKDRTRGSISTIAPICADIICAVGTHIAVRVVAISAHVVAWQLMRLAAAYCIQNGKGNDRQPCTDSDRYFNNTHSVWASRHV